MRIYSYIVKHDTGFAPNPFFGVCTLACCKPGIRRTAQKGDWIVGLTPKADGNQIVYYMEVEKSVGFDEYWKRFKRKQPNPQGGVKQMNGDNIYQPQRGGTYRQLPSAHSEPKFGNRENPKMKRRDLSGERVLISRKFAYFGSDPKHLPPEFKEALRVGRGYRCLSDQVAAEFQSFVRKRKWGRGVRAQPRHWPKGDESWKTAACGKV